MAWDARAHRPRTRLQARLGRTQVQGKIRHVPGLGCDHRTARAFARSALVGTLALHRVRQVAGRNMSRHEYLIAELRCASLRARLWQADIDAVGLALKAGLVEPEQALELLADCDCLQLVGIRDEIA